MALTLRQLRYFLVLAEELHFGRAAQRLHISQPPLSTSLRQLEEELEVRLLERNSKRVVLTPAGDVFQRQARRLLEQLADSQDLIKRIAASTSGLLRVGFTPAMIFRQLPEILTDLKAHHPGIDIQLVEKNSANQLEAIGQGQLDIGFIHSMPLPPGFATLTLVNEEFVCCLPAQHPLANRDAIHIRDLLGEPLVMFARDLAPHYYDRIVSLFHVADIEPTISHEVSHWLTIVALIAHGMGTALVPKALTGFGLSSVVFLPLADTSVHHQSHCVWPSEGDNELRDLLIDCVRQKLGEAKG